MVHTQSWKTTQKLMPVTPLLLGTWRQTSSLVHLVSLRHGALKLLSYEIVTPYIRASNPSHAHQDTPLSRASGVPRPNKTLFCQWLPHQAEDIRKGGSGRERGVSTGKFISKSRRPCKQQGNSSLYKSCDIYIYITPTFLSALQQRHFSKGGV